VSDSKIISVESDKKRQQIVIRYQLEGVKNVVRFGFNEKEKLAEFKRTFASAAKEAALNLIRDQE
jgi:hypothetical protein